MNRVLLILITAIICCGIGCGTSRAERDCEKIVQSLEERVQKRIASVGTLEKAGLSPDELLRQKQFWALAIASDQSMIAMLKKQGPEAYQQQPLVFGELAPRPSNANQTLSYSQLMELQWLEQGCEMTGFYFELDDGTNFDFKDTIERSDEECTELVRAGPSRDASIPFSLDTDPPTEKSVIRLTPEQYAKVFEERRVRRVGLISKDGVKSEAGPIGYSARIVGISTYMAPASETD